MFIGVTGEPGSGKSAYAVDFVLKNKENYNNVYVNINGFKMYDNIKPLNFPKLLEIVSHCKDIYDTQIEQLGNTSNDNVIDEPIMEYLLEIGFLSKNSRYEKYIIDIEKRNKEPFLNRSYLNIFKRIEKESEYLPTLFVVDEAQNHFGAIDPGTGKEKKTADPILTWLVSYHRHLYMDFLILSQQYQKLHIAYRRDIGYFIDGIESQSLPLGNFSPSFVYNKHKESPYSNKNKTGKVKVKKRKELFEAYQSGDKVRTKSVILPWLIFAGVVSVVLIIGFSYFLSTFSPDTEDNNITAVVKNKIQKFTKIENSSMDSDFSNFTYLKLTCIADTCTNKLHKIELNVDDLNLTVTNTQSKFLNVKKYSRSLGFVTILASRDFINLFQGANNGKENTQGFSLLN